MKRETMIARAATPCSDDPIVSTSRPGTLGRVLGAQSREYLDVIYSATSPRQACARATGTAEAMLAAAGQR